MRQKLEQTVTSHVQKAVTAKSVTETLGVIAVNQVSMEIHVMFPAHRPASSVISMLVTDIVGTVTRVFKDSMELHVAYLVLQTVLDLVTNKMEPAGVNQATNLDHVTKV